MPLCFTTETTETQFYMEGGSPKVNLEYSVDEQKTWNEFIAADTIVTLPNIGDKIYFRAGSQGNNCYDGNYFYILGEASVAGNIMSLLNQNFENLTTIPSSNCFCRLFYQTNITSAKDLKLPATTLTYACYDRMFNGSYIKDAPELPATTLADDCYAYMFESCSKLKTAPELPATTLADNCYAYMFNYCEALENSPTLPATTLTNSCYYFMFSGCSSLKTVPELPATTLTDACYACMFSGCPISSLKVHFTDWNEGNSTYDWLYDYSPTGTFYCPKELPIVRLSEENIYGIPVNWNVITF